MVAIGGRKWQQIQTMIFKIGRKLGKPRGGMVDTKDLKSDKSLLRHRSNKTENKSNRFIIGIVLCYDSVERFKLCH